MNSRRQFASFLLIAGGIVPLMVLVSPWVGTMLEVRDIGIPQLGDFGLTFILAIGVTSILSLVAISRKYGLVGRTSPHRAFFFLLMLGFYFSILPGPYVGTLLLAYYAGLIVAVMIGHEVRIRFLPINWMMLAFLAICALGLSVMTQAGTYLQVRELLVPFSRFLSLLFIVNYLRTWNDYEYVAKVFLAIGTVVMFVAFYQTIMFSAFGQVTSLMNPNEGSRRFFRLAGFTFLRATGLFRHPAYLGEIGVLGCLMLLVQLMRPDLPRKERIASLLVFAIFTAGTVVSFSRTSWLAYLVVALVAPPLLRPKWAVRYVLVLIALGSIFVLSGAMTSIIEYTASTKSSSLDYRVQIIKLGFRAFTEHPVLGTGLDGFLTYPGNTEHFHVHNSFMMAFTETGMIGGTIFIVIYLHATIRAVRNIYLATEEKDRSLSIVLLLALVMIIVMQQFEQALHFHMNYFLLGAIEAMTPYLEGKLGSDPDLAFEQNQIRRLTPRAIES